MADIFYLVTDAVGVSIMGAVGLYGMRYFAYVLRKDDLKGVRYIWVPSFISGAFFFVLVLGLLINDVFGNYLGAFYFSIHPFLLVGSGFFALSVYRFVKTIKDHMETEKRAKTSVRQMVKELEARREAAR